MAGTIATRDDYLAAQAALHADFTHARGLDLDAPWPDEAVAEWNARAAALTAEYRGTPPSGERPGRTAA